MFIKIKYHQAPMPKEKVKWIGVIPHILYHEKTELCYISQYILSELTKSKRTISIAQSIEQVINFSKKRKDENLTLHLNNFLMIRRSILLRKYLKNYISYTRWLNVLEQSLFPEVSILSSGNDHLAVNLQVVSTPHATKLIFGDLEYNINNAVLLIENRAFLSIPELIIKESKMDTDLRKILNQAKVNRYGRK
jgi:hypothetical protein